MTVNSLVALLCVGCDTVMTYPLAHDAGNAKRFVYDGEKAIVFSGVALDQVLPSQQRVRVWMIAPVLPEKTGHFEVEIGQVPQGWCQLFPKDQRQPILESRQRYELMAGTFLVYRNRQGDLVLGLPGGMGGIRWAFANFVWGEK
jgi:hypothetical protein